MTRYCKKCTETKPLDTFPEYKPGCRRHVCYTCFYANTRDWVESNRDHSKTWHREYKQKLRETDIGFRDYERKVHRKSTYSLSVEEFDIMAKDQNGCCAICLDFLAKPEIDHCHSSGKVRGLLCHRCNSIVGQYEANRLKDKVIPVSLIEKYLGLSPKE